MQDCRCGLSEEEELLPLVGWLPLIYYVAVGAREPAGLQALCASHQSCWPQPWHSRESSPGTGLCIYPSGVPWSCCGFTHQVLSLCTAQGGANLVRRLCVTPGPLRHPSKRVSPRAHSPGTLWPLGSFLDMGILCWGILGEESYWDITDADEGQES